ncbi:uncharacterized protein LOC119568818 [Penaeus monodon]|uniref:uncharacterized protein LOC119568818 n=1 Tax=Penaeus monodon TaxID=6687 RepID=UPI0018A6F53E|nr:uncharacterized protein LOC119568818 [Penaeus monodon]
MRCKLLMRQLTSLKEDTEGDALSWDDPIPHEMYNQSVYLFRDMYDLERIRFKRCVRPDSAVGNPTLVMYADASNLAYSTCAYVRFKLQNGSYLSQLLTAKSRIAPIRQITIPRLELCAAVLSTRLRKVIERETQFVFERVLHSVDSMIVRSQIQKESHGFGTFVATRVAEIQTLTNTDEWWWVASDGNVADFATRLQHPSSLGVDSLWQMGRKYLTLPISQWPISQPCMQELPDRTCISFTCNLGINCVQSRPIIDIERFSSYEKLIKTTATLHTELHSIDHGGVDLTLAKLQSKFWVPGARRVKSVKEKCVTCRKVDKLRMEQKMGQLPDKRLKPSPAFYNTSVDLFGPFLIRDTVKRRSRAKVYESNIYMFY